MASTFPTFLVLRKIFWSKKKPSEHHCRDRIGDSSPARWSWRFQLPVLEGGMFFFHRKVFRKKNTWLRWSWSKYLMYIYIIHMIHNVVGGWTNPFEKYARQLGSFPQVRVKLKNIWNHHLDNVVLVFFWRRIKWHGSNFFHVLLKTRVHWDAPMHSKGTNPHIHQTSWNWKKWNLYLPKKLREHEPIGLAHHLGKKPTKTQWIWPHFSIPHDQVTLPCRPGLLKTVRPIRSGRPKWAQKIPPRPSWAWGGVWRQRPSQ